MKNKGIRYLTEAAMIAAIYVVLTYLFQAISFGDVQIRIAEALTILPMFTPAAIPGIFVGCLLGNILGGALLPDIIFGSLASLAAAFFTRRLSRSKPYIGALPPILANMIFVPLILRYAYGLTLPIPLMMLTVGIGEVISCGILGSLLYYVLNRQRKVIFRSED